MRDPGNCNGNLVCNLLTAVFFVFFPVFVVAQFWANRWGLLIPFALGALALPFVPEPGRVVAAGIVVFVAIPLVRAAVIVLFRLDRYIV